MELLVLSLLNGLSYGLLLFMLSAGLTLIFSLMGVLNFAHGSFYMLGAYLAHSLSAAWGFWWALLVSPLLVGALAAMFYAQVLQRVAAHGHVAELLVTFGLSYVLLEVVQLVWGRGPVDYRVPAALSGSVFTLWNVRFPAYRAFSMGVALLVLGALALWLRLSRGGLVVQAALSHPKMAQALGHNVPRVFMGVFACGAGLAALAGVLGGNAFVTEPGMAATVGSIVFVVAVVGGLGSLWGAFWASLLMGLLQTAAVALDLPLGGVRLSQLAPLLPYAMLVGMLALHPRGLMGQRES
ncbi:branched-chain amino acid ABC transporter permease [Hydrogenophaga atypica]|uniref:Branched-chain amino acid ABC transporter permease n=1 Tax=Hydrogenophaga atypica TaxID=249409 RepID=A0ABW2QMU8_9BURK